MPVDRVSQQKSIDGVGGDVHRVSADFRIKIEQASHKDKERTRRKTTQPVVPKRPAAFDALHGQKQAGAEYVAAAYDPQKECSGADGVTVHASDETGVIDDQSPKVKDRKHRGQQVAEPDKEIVFLSQKFLGKVEKDKGNANHSQDHKPRPEFGAWRHKGAVEKRT